MDAAEVLAQAALDAPQDHPVSEAITKTRRGQARELTSVNPLILVDTIRSLAILGEHEVVDRGYAEWTAMPDGPVHFEAGLAALMAANLAEAEARFLRAVKSARPQPMAWNSLALVRLSRLEIDAAKQAIDAGLRAMPGDLVTMRTSALVDALKGTRQKSNEVMLLLERFPGHAQLARDAAETLPAGAARTLLERRAGELDGRPLLRAGTESKPAAPPKIVDCTQVTVEAGERPKVRLALSPHELERVIAGDILRFTVGGKLVHLQRNDVTPAEPAPNVRLRLIPRAFSDLRLGSVTPLFSDVPFTLELSLRSSSGGGGKLVTSKEDEDPLTAAYGTLIGGALMLVIGALRSLGRYDSTDSLMMLIGGGMIAYGAYKWIALRIK